MNMRRLVDTLILLFLCIIAAPVFAEERKNEWFPTASFPEQEISFDWVRLTNGEWLNGEIISLRKKSLTFDSDHFDEITIDRDDVEELHSSGNPVVVLDNNQTLTGKVSLVGETLVIRGRDREKMGAPRRIMI